MTAAPRTRPRTAICLAVVVVAASAGAVGCSSLSSGEPCTTDQLTAFRQLPRVERVRVKLRQSPEIGCTDTVTVRDPQAFVRHYEEAMREAGWKVLTDSGSVYGKTSSGGVRVDALEGHSVGIYATSSQGQ